MKITFIDPPNYKPGIVVERVFGCNLTIYPIPNIFTLTLAALLQEKGYQVCYIDAANMGGGVKRFVRFLKSDDSDILSIHSVNLSQEMDLQALRIIREIKGNLPVVFTGPAPTLKPNDYLLDEYTFIVRGEPEITFLELVNKFSEAGKRPDFSQLQGLSFRDEQGIKDNPARQPIQDLDSLPFPNRGLLKRHLYFNPKLAVRPWTAVLTSRGCSFRCLFCVPCSLSFARELEYKRFFQRKPPVRLRSAENVIEEFRLLKQQGFRSVSIIDDNFTWGEERVEKICAGIKDLGIVWGCLSRADLITERLARALALSHCRYVDIGVESFDQKTLDYVYKDLKVEDIFRALKILKEYNIEVKLNVLIGASPFETKETVLKNIEITKRLKPSNVMFSLVSPFPGTDYYQICKENNWFKYTDYVPTNIQKKAIVNYPYLSSQDLESLARKANLRIYLDVWIIWQALKKIRSPKTLFDAISAYLRKIKFD